MLVLSYHLKCCSYRCRYPRLCSDREDPSTAWMAGRLGRVARYFATRARLFLGEVRLPPVPRIAIRETDRPYPRARCFFAQHGKAGWNKHGGNRADGVTVEGEKVDTRVLNAVIGHLPGSRQQCSSNGQASAVRQVIIQPIITPGERQVHAKGPFVCIIARCGSIRIPPCRLQQPGFRVPYQCGIPKDFSGNRLTANGVEKLPTVNIGLTPNMRDPLVIRIRCGLGIGGRSAQGTTERSMKADQPQ